MSEINLLRDLKQISKKENDIQAEFHKWPWGSSGASANGSCIDLRAKKTVGIKLPDLTGMKADKGAAEIGTMGHEFTQQKLRDKYKSHTKTKIGTEIYMIQPIVPPSDHEITVNIETSVLYPKGTVLKNLGITSISPWDIITYELKDPTMAMTGLIEKPVQFRNVIAEVPFLNMENITNLKITDIKTSGDFGFYKMLKEGLPWRYQAQGLTYIKKRNLPYIDFLIIHKEKNRKYIIRLFWSDELWERVVRDSERTLLLAYETLEYGSAETCWADFECLQKEIGWYFCPLSVVKETIDKSKRKRMEILSFCPRAQELLIKDRDKLFPIESSWKLGSRGYAYIEKHEKNLKGIAMVTYTTKTEWNKKIKGNSYTTKEIPLVQAFTKFKPLDWVEPQFPMGQTLIEYQKEPEIEMCTECENFVAGCCEGYGCVPSSYPERPEWCFFPIPKEDK